MAIISNLLMEQGATFSVTIGYNRTDGTSKDLTNFTARSQMRKSYYSANAVTFSANVTDAANGEITISLTPAETANVKSGRYVYDLEIEDNEYGDVERVVEGIITVLPEVTR